jgi:hypothetical protein
MIRKKDTQKNDKIENLIINADLSIKPVTQLENITVLRAEIFKYADNKNSTDLVIGIDTDLYLDMMIDIQKQDKKSFHFTTSVQYSYNEVIEKFKNNDNLYFSDGMLCSIDDDFNLEIIREKYYE